MQKVQIFENDNRWDLKNEINEFAKTHHIEQISYAVTPHYHDYYSCCVLYTEKENEENYLTNF